MSGKYSYSDKSHFSEPADAQEYSDDAHQQNGNGIYNDYTVDLQPKEYSSTFKLACFRFTNTRRTKCFLFGGLLALCVLLIVIIAIASGSRKISADPEKPVKTLGLIAYGPDLNGRIGFNPSLSTTYMPTVKRIDTAMADYSTIHQFLNHEIFIPCNDSTQSVPDGKVCRYTADIFGDKCQSVNLYGMEHGRPCVLLVLKLPDGVLPVPLNFTDAKNIDVKSKIHERASSNAVSINCEGKTEADESQIIKNKHTGPFIDYHPNDGFPLYSFLWRDHKDYVWPAVMVKFNTVTTNHEVTVICTAYGENLKDKMYSTEFTFNMI